MQNRSLFFLAFAVLMLWPRLFENQRSADRRPAEEDPVEIRLRIYPDRGLFPEESRFFEEIERQAGDFYQAFETEMPGMNQSSFQTYTRWGVEKFRRLSNWKEFLIKSSKTVGIAFVAGSMLSTLVGILVGCFYDKALGAAILAFPGGFVAGSVALLPKVLHRYYQLMQKIDLRKIPLLNRLKKEILGFDEGAHAFTFIYDDLETEAHNLISVHVLDRAHARNHALNTLGIEDLEEIVRASGKRGEIFLYSSYYDRSKARSYAFKLLVYIQKDELSRARLVEVMRSNFKAEAQSQMQSVLVSFANLKRECQELRSELFSMAQKYKRVRWDHSRDAHLLLEDNLQKLRRFESHIQQAEFLYLDALSRKNPYDLTEDFKLVGSDLRTYREILDELRAWELDAGKIIHWTVVQEKSANLKHLGSNIMVPREAQPDSCRLASEKILKSLAP